LKCFEASYVENARFRGVNVRFGLRLQLYERHDDKRSFPLERTSNASANPPRLRTSRVVSVRSRMAGPADLTSRFTPTPPSDWSKEHRRMSGWNTTFFSLSCLPRQLGSSPRGSVRGSFSLTNCAIPRRCFGPELLWR